MKHPFFYLIIFLFAIASCSKKEDSLPKLPESEERLGGDATTYDFSFNAFGHAVEGLSVDQRGLFVTGNSLFKQNWVTAPASTSTRDGLGPMMNAPSCSSCHSKDGRGKLPAPGEEPTGLLIRLGNNNEPHAVYGGQLQNRAIQGVAPEASVMISYQEMFGEFDDGKSYSLRKPEYRFESYAYGGSLEGEAFSPRLGPQIIGMGLLEQIPEEEILANADEFDADGDGISGRANYVWSHEHDKLMIGRFGWKAGQPTLRQQVAAAFNGDLGITSSLFPQEEITSAQEELLGLPNGGTPEIEDHFLDMVTFYNEVLAVPARRDINDEEVLKGQQIFSALNCDGCHKTRMVTGDYSIAALSRQQFMPYTDLLLHDMGEELSDNRMDGLAEGREWRTPPLWGLGLHLTVTGELELMHDGRARGIEEAILWHGGEAEKSREEYKALSAEDREALIRFLNTL